MANISISSPLIKSFTHATTTISTTATSLLATAAAGQRRTYLIIQNQSGANTVTVIFNDTGSAGIVLQPSTLFTIENYNGPVRALASAASTNVHVAYATA
jgi:hypothetical protein